MNRRGTPTRTALAVGDIDQDGPVVGSYCVAAAAWLVTDGVHVGAPGSNILNSVDERVGNEDMVDEFAPASVHPGPTVALLDEPGRIPQPLHIASVGLVAPGHWKETSTSQTHESSHHPGRTLDQIPDPGSTPRRLHKADAVADALAAAVTTLPTPLARSLTWDQGHQMAQHQKFTTATGIQVYFCDPKSPWQRGNNENTDGLLRQYLPRRLDFRTLTQADLPGKPRHRQAAWPDRKPCWKALRTASRCLSSAHPCARRHVMMED